jgi:TPR repeat protein
LALLEQDPVAAVALLEQGASGDDPEFKNLLASVLYNPPVGVEADRSRAVTLWEAAAAEGSDSARLNLGTQLLMNDDAGDDAKAVDLLQAIRNEQALPLTAYPLGRAYLFGQGVERDLRKGGLLLKAATEADASNIDAQYLLALAYGEGWGVEADPANAFVHMTIAADGGDPRAQWEVGMMLLQGEGTSADPARARAYVQGSAEAGYVPGMISMAVMSATGEGGPVDGAAARAWYEQAAVAGSAHALRGLGGMLMTGEGGPADMVTGAAYLDLAAKAGDDRAPALQQYFAEQLANIDPAAVEAVKARWLREHGVPR